MAELVADCPRCGAKHMTFDLENQLLLGKDYGWKAYLEVFCICRQCKKSTTFLVSQRETYDDEAIKKGLQNLKHSANQVVDVVRFVGVRDTVSSQPPEYIPKEIEQAFKEGAACYSIGCYNAAAAMYRLCIDLATKSMLPEQAEGLNNTIRRNLGHRLPWMFDNGILPESLRDLSTCIKEDGNDGAHQGNLTGEDAADIEDFTYILLERLYTEPERIKLANERRAARHQK